MKKKVLAFFMALAMTFAFVAPAYAAGLNSNEQNLLNEFSAEMDKWPLDKEHKDQYYGEAQSALNAVDLDAAACDDFSQAIKDVHSLLSQYDIKTQGDLWEHYKEIADIVNKVGAKYYKLHVTVDSTKHYAKVTWEVDGKTSTAASSSKVVKQTGFGVGQTVAVAGVSVAVLVGAYAVARKKQLFVK